MTTRIVRDHQDLKMLLQFLKEHKLPFVVTIAKGVQRTYLQNKLQRKWINEIAEQLGDRTPEEVRGEIKLRFGVPMLRAENEAFCEKYDRLIKPRPYAEKLEIMMEPIDCPITRIMTTEQKKRFLDQVFYFYTEKGFVLTEPEDKRHGPPVGEKVKESAA